MAVTTLLELGADPNSTDVNGQTSLHTAESIGAKDMADLLIQNGAKVIAEDNARCQPWMIAALKSQKELKKHLESLAFSKSVVAKDICNGMPSNSEEFSGTIDPGKKDVVDQKLTELLKEGVESGSISICKAVLEAGTDPNASATELKEAALHLACATEWSGIVKLLLKSGARHDVINMEGSSSIHIAAAQGRSENIRILAKARANLHAQTINKETPLHVAARAILGIKSPPMQDTESITTSRVAELLSVYQKEAGELDLAELKKLMAAREHDSGAPLLLALFCYRVDFAMRLIEAGAATDVRDKYGHAALYLAGLCGDKSLIETLLSRGLNVNETDCRDITCLHNVIRNTYDENDEDSFEIFRCLIEAGADLSSNNVVKMSALQCACNVGNEAFVKELLEASPKEEINVEGRVYGTPLYIGAFRGRAKIVSMLLDAGADINRGRSRESPLEAASGWSPSCG